MREYRHRVAPLKLDNRGMARILYISMFARTKALKTLNANVLNLVPLLIFVILIPFGIDRKNNLIVSG